MSEDRRLSQVAPRVILVGIFGLSIGIGFLLWNRISLPFRNPQNIKGILTQIQFNPLNNIVRFLIAVFTPCLVLLIIYLFFSKRYGRELFASRYPRSTGDIDCQRIISKRIKIALIIALLIFTVITLLGLYDTGIWYFRSWVPGQVHSVDAFHDGETLAPAISYMQGQVPYKDFQFAHGLYQDPLRSVLAFKLCGKSIASMQGFQTMDFIIMFLALAFLIYKLFEGDLLYTFLSMLVLFVLMGMRWPQIRIIMPAPREVMPIIFLIVLLYLYNLLKQDIKHGPPVPYRRKINFCCFLLSFLPFAGLAYSIDRGTYILLTYVILIPAIYFTFIRKTDLARGAVSFSALGIAGGILFLGFLLRWSFGEFFHFAFIFVPRFKELADGFVYPINLPRGYIMVVLIALNTFWIFYKFLQCVQDEKRRILPGASAFFRRYLIEFALGLLAILNFRNALGRAENLHIMYSSLLTFVLTILIVLKHYIGGYGTGKKFALWAHKKAGALVLAALILATSFYSIYRIVNKSVLAGAFPFGTEDEVYEQSIGWTNALNFLKDNLEPQERFMTMTNELLWYYFMDMPQPTKYPFAFYSMQEACQDEIIRDMQQKNVKLLVMNDSSWSCNLDGIPNADRMPKVYEYIRSHYAPFANVDGVDIWIRSEY